MRLTELNPRWCAAGGEGISNADGTPAPRREGIGILFDCPCGGGHDGLVPFTNPLDGGPPLHGVTWERTGDTFETLTLKPSINAIADGHCRGWHGFITNGEVTGA